MAIDTLALRESALLDVMITPDGTIDQGDRMSMLGQFASYGPVDSPASGIQGISPTWGNSLYKPMRYAPLRYAPARWKPPRYRKPF